MSGYLTTHVLDTASGKPASGMAITLYRDNSGNLEKLKSVVTNEDGRCDGPILSEAEFAVGIYELHFMAGDYLKTQGGELPNPLFLNVVPIRFGMADKDSHYHVPLLISPFGYSTYRGS